MPWPSILVNPDTFAPLQIDFSAQSISGIDPGFFQAEMQLLLPGPFFALCDLGTTG